MMNESEESDSLQYSAASMPNADSRDEPMTAGIPTNGSDRWEQESFTDIHRFQSPLPPPSVMAAYKDVDVGLPGEVVELVRSEAQWRRESANEQMRADIRIDNLRVWFPLVAFTVYLLFIVAGCWLVPDWTGWILFGIGLPFSLLFGTGFIVSARIRTPTQDGHASIEKS